MRYDELAADLRAHYETTGCRDPDEADGRFAHLKAFFAGQRAATIGQTDATAFVARRQGQGAANGTINRELAVLIRMLRLSPGDLQDVARRLMGQVSGQVATAGAR